MCDLRACRKNSSNTIFPSFSFEAVKVKARPLFERNTIFAWTGSLIAKRDRSRIGKRLVTHDWDPDRCWSRYTRRFIYSVIPPEEKELDIVPPLIEITWDIIDAPCFRPKRYYLLVSIPSCFSSLFNEHASFLERIRKSKSNLVLSRAWNKTLSAFIFNYYFNI